MGSEMRKYKAGKILNKILKVIGRVYFGIISEYKIDNKQLSSIKPPYIVLANHTNFWDPFLVSMCIPEPIYFVTSDAYFRNPILKQLLKLVGAIPKTKNTADTFSIRAILDVVKRNGVIGIFPEGRRSWDGKTLPLVYSTAKLIKHLNIPVVSVKLKGACLSMPRWALTTRRGRLEMSLSKLLDPDMIRSLTVDETYSVITNGLSYDEYEYQRQHMHVYKGKRLAEKLELFLFACPHCHSIGNLCSNDSTFSCTCGYSVIYNEKGFFESPDRKPYFDNPRDWNLWQLDHLKRLIASHISSGNTDQIFEEKDITLLTGNKTDPLKITEGRGELRLYSDRIDYAVSDKLLYSFKLNAISGENIQFNNQFEFIYANCVYRFKNRNGLMPAYKWVKAVEAAKAGSDIGITRTNR